MAPRNNLGNTFPCGARKHPVVVFMNICLIFMSINRPERGTSSSLLMPMASVNGINVKKKKGKKRGKVEN